METNKNFVFWGLVLITVLLFFNGAIALLFSGIKTYPVFPPVYNRMNVILETKTKNPDDIILKINNDYFSIPASKNLLNKVMEGKTDSIDILVNREFKEEIKSIVIFNDLKVHYYKDFSDFEKEETQLCPDKNCKIYDKYKIPLSVKYNKNSNSINFHSFPNLICNVILSLFSGNSIFVIPYILLFITLIYFKNNRDKIKIIKISGYLLTGLIFVFGILTFSNGMLDYLPWTDEYRTIEYSDPKLPFMTIFSDPGNPPVFYFLFRIFIGVFGTSILTMKIFPFITGILAIFLLWFYLKKEFDVKTANIGAFLAFVNVPLVYYGIETRSYILQALFSPVLIWVLFKILYTNKRKYYIFYALLAAVISNIHYYEILLLVSNFVYVFIYFLIQRRYKDILKFFLSNLFGVLFFLPFFIMTAFNKALVNSSFNNWIPPICYAQIKKCVYYLFGGRVSLLLSFIFFIKVLFKSSVQNEKRNNVIIYSFFVIIFTIFQAVSLSYIIRPMLVERYLLLLSPVFIIFLSLIFTSEYKNKFITVLFIIWFIFIQSGSFEKNNRRKGILEIPLTFSKQYFERAKNKNENIYTVLNFSNPEYLENRDYYMKDGITYISRSVFAIEETIDEILNSDKNAVIFTSTLNASEKNSKTPDNYKCFFNASTDTCLWKIENF